jgi:hypothetical protein
VLDALGSEALEKRVEPSDGEGDPARARPRRVRLDEERGVFVDLPEDLFTGSPRPIATGFTFSQNLSTTPVRIPPSHPRMAGQRLVQRADDERAIPNSRRHSFRRAASHIPDGEDLRSCRLKEQRLAAAAFSMLGEARVTPRVLAGYDESLLVEAYQA